MSAFAAPRTREELFEARAIDLTVISPIHIGAREGRLTALEFAFRNGRTYVIDEDRLGLFLREKNLIDRFVEATRVGPVDLKNFLEKGARSDSADALTRLSRYMVLGGSTQMREFRPFIRDGMGRLFLPGTSIKGVLRTSILYSALLEDEGRLQEVRKSAEVNLPQIGPLKENAKKNYSARWLQGKLLEDYAMANARKGPNTDILRCLRVRDAYPVGNAETRVIKLEFLSKRSGGEFYWSRKKRGSQDTPHALELWVEALIGGTFRVEVVWDKALFARFLKENANRKHPVNGIEDLFARIFQMSKHVAAHESQFYAAKPTGTQDQKASSAATGLNGWYKSSGERIMRIGFGSGMLSTTVNLTFPESLRQKIRDVCGHRRPGDPAPKSRRVWNGMDGHWYPMGWMAVDLIGKGGDTTLAGVVGIGKGAAALATSAPVFPAKDAVRLQPKARSPQIASPPVRPVVHAATSLGLAELKKQTDIIQANDRLAVERIVKALEGLKSENEQREAALYIRNKLEKANLWKKHPLRLDIEDYLAEGEEDD